ncbi:hypothetical protein IDG48_02600 [Pelagibacterales bacterium SAG-MED12]|nr:hypothetical protein [Pelagibacterales bacterium SAG-MED12]
MKKLLVLFFGTALLFSTSAHSDVTIGLKAGNGDLEGTNASYTAGSNTYASTTASKDSMFGAIFAELSLGDSPVSIGVEYVPLDADLTLDGKNSSTSANVEDYTTAYLLYKHDTGSNAVYGKLGYSQADIGTIKSKSTVNSQSSELEGYMVGAGIETGELASGFVGRFEVTYTLIDEVHATTTSNGSSSVKKTADGELVTITFGLSKSF